MGRMRGLLYKERVTTQGGLLLLAITVIVTVGAAPFLLHHYVSTDTTVASFSFILSAVWFLLLSYMPLIWLLMSLAMEMKRPDLWLHTPASSGLLIGTKALFAAAVTIATLVWVAVVLGAVFLLSGGAKTLPDGLTAASFAGFFCEIGLLILLFSLMQMSVGFLFWSVYQSVRLRSSRLIAVPVTVAGILLFFFISEKISRTSAGSRLLGAGEIGLPNIEKVSRGLDIGLDMSGSLSMGGFLFGSVIALIAFGLGTWLFNRKVAGA
ncbi:hypothetical protein ACFFIY_12035 [Bhargavaea ullalensis]|uniref:ABC-2 type transport system permease protein n=1 Tax=Bhargavaea ullalensis TaxID=1265685 RepID=A0ABV2G7F0_9BACL